jgi:hypothetical protein
MDHFPILAEAETKNGTIRAYLWRVILPNGGNFHAKDGKLHRT